MRCWEATLFGAAQDRRLAILLYGFPPGVGATGTAALLNVPKSLENTLEALRVEGYNLGNCGGRRVDGEAIVAALKMQEDQRAIAEGAAGIERRQTPCAPIGAPCITWMPVASTKLWLR